MHGQLRRWGPGAAELQWAGWMQHTLDYARSDAQGYGYCGADGDDVVNSISPRTTTVPTLGVRAFWTPVVVASIPG